MIRKTALLAGVAGAMLFAAPSLAQDAPPAPSTQAAPPASVTVQPGSTVKGEGGVELGTLQGVRTNAAGEQELEVRGADGQLRAVPLGGLQQDGDALVVAWSKAQFDASAAIQPSAPPAAEPNPTPPPAPDPSMPVMPAAPPVGEPTQPPVPTPPTLSPDAPAQAPAAEPTPDPNSPQG